MAREETTIAAADGDCATWVFTPDQGAGPWPAVIFFMDALAIRPALFDMAQRLADGGYVVVLPDLFYRFGPYEELDPAAVFASENPRSAFAPMMETIDGPKAAKDTTALLAYLDTRGDVAGNKVGTTGYCMGGGLALHAAAAHPERVGAAASFHGGRLATDNETSPHKVVSQITGRVYIGAADNDGSYPPEQAALLCQTLMEGHVDFRHELYPGAAHGWTMPDFPIYDQAGSDRHFDELFRMFGETLT